MQFTASLITAHQTLDPRPETGAHQTLNLRLETGAHQTLNLRLETGAHQTLGPESASQFFGLLSVSSTG
jgi:hypothetical protein